MLRLLIVTLLGVGTALTVVYGYGRSRASAAATTDQHPPINDRTLLWSEEFDGERLDTSRWNLGNTPASNLRNDEVANAPAVCLANGLLALTAGSEDGYSLTTNGKHHFRYGRVEIRARVPRAAGVEPAFCLVRSANNYAAAFPVGIDVVRYVGDRPGEIRTGVHGKFGAQSHTTALAGIEEDFHRYAAEWTAGGISFFVDDRMVHTVSQLPEEAQSLAGEQSCYLSLTMIGEAIAPDREPAAAAAANTFFIDYVRVYAPE